MPRHSSSHWLSGRCRARYTVLAILTSVLACHQSTSEADLVTWCLNDGRTLAEWASEKPAAFLIMDPDQCLTCYSVLAHWQRERSNQDVPLYVILTRELTHQEHRTLIVSGVHHDGHLISGGPPRSHLPLEIAAQGEQLVYARTRVTGLGSPLLALLQDTSLAGLDPIEKAISPARSPSEH